MNFFSANFFMPHGHCYLWQPALVWLQAGSNALIGLAYVAISATLAVLVSRIKDLPFKLIYLAFGVFIISCGFTHFFDVWTIWVPSYWLDGAVRFATAIASVGTAFLLPPLIPQAVAIAQSAKTAHERGLALETAYKDLGALYEKSKELEALKSQFFANVSHELRTPLTLIAAPIEKMLTDPALDASQRWSLDVVAKNARTLSNLVDDLLDFAKLDAGRLTADYAHVDLTSLLRRLGENFALLEKSRAVTLTLDVGETLTCELDPGKMERVILNLLANAFKYTPDGGKIRCSARTVGGVERGVEGGIPMIELVVADNGPGIAPEHREIVFERFRQAARLDAPQAGGTGLGLAIVKEFVSLHGGQVWIEDAPEGGAALRVLIPRYAPNGVAIAAGARDEAKIAEPHAAAPALPAPDAAAPRALVVEDNRDMNQLIAASLSDYHVQVAFDGEEGLALAEATPPDVIISDVMMPRLDGEHLIKALRQRPALSHVPVMLLSAKGDVRRRVDLLKEGAQDFLVKPFAIEELRVRVRNLAMLKRTRDALAGEVGAVQEDLDAMARELAEHRRKLELSLESARVARDQALRASQVKSSFMSMISHELRTPLTTIQLHLQILLRDAANPLGDKQLQRALKIGASAERLLHLVDSLLEYARIQSDRIKMQTATVDLARLVGEVVEDMRALAENKGLKLTAEAPPLPPIFTDQNLLRIVISNLVDNAVKYTASGGITVTAQAHAGGQLVCVADTGAGIAESFQARIFEPFEQLEAVSKKHTPGIGLGLAIVRELVEALGGRISLSSELGRGSEFRVWVPESYAELVPQEDSEMKGAR